MHTSPENLFVFDHNHHPVDPVHKSQYRFDRSRFGFQLCTERETDLPQKLTMLTLLLRML